MTLIDIDEAASKRRLQEIASASKAAVDARLRQVGEQAERDRETAEREETDLKAALERKAGAEAAAAAASAPEEEAKPRPKPATLSLGGEEFAQAREARQVAAEEPQPAPEPAPVVSEPPAPGRTLRLGAPEDRGEDTPPQEKDKPVRRRPPRPDGDDDMSGRTWLR